MFETIEVSADGPRGELVLDRPDKLNPLSPHTLREIAAAARWFDTERPEVRVVVVSGRGRVFSAGADVSAFTERGDAAVARADADAGRLMAEALEQMSAIAVARIHGWCVGGGLVLAAACDLRVAADDTRFSIPEVDLGIPLAWGGIPRLVREIGPAATKELVITCREFDAAEALRLGLLNRVVAPEELDATVDELAAAIAGKPRYAAQATKRHVNAVTEGLSQAGRSWADADGLLAGMRDPEGRASAAAYLDRVRARRSGGAS
jgi:enoyl-CoA hydratase/carnithine racemase